jgi:hypothetical protein
MATTFKVKINDNGMINLWKQESSQPSDTDTWRDAIELEAEPTVTTRYLVIPQYDLSTSPVGISYQVIESTVAERQQLELRKVKNTFLTTINSMLHLVITDQTVFDITVIEQAKITLDANIQSITSATTHDELDSY